MPTCNTCGTPAPVSYEIQYNYSNQCYSCGDASCNGASSNTKCVVYTGAALPCAGIATNDTLEDILIKIDSQICSVTGNYASYTYHCITPQTTEAGFVSAITDYVCNLNTTVTTFIGTTFPAYQSTVNSRFVALEVPGIICATASVTNTDTLQQILTKYCTKLTTLDTAVSLSGITWNNCFTVVSTPTTIHDAFSEVLSQICQTKSLISSSSLPVFNNSSNCLAGTSSDTLVTTIGLLTSKVCSAAVVTVGSLTTSCLTLGSTLQTALQAIITKVDTLTQHDVTFSGDFTITATDAMNPCAGRTVALATPLNADRFVASNASDASPGTLISKLQAGTNITLDDTTTPGKVIVNTTAVDRKVSAATADASPGFLVDKLEGSTVNGITITPVYNSSTGKVTLQLSVDADFCAAVVACTGAACNTYSLHNTSIASISVQYIPCGSTTPITISISPSSTTTVCAVLYSVVPAVDAITVIATGSCTP